MKTMYKENLSVYIGNIFALTISLLDVQIMVAILVGIASLIYTVYRIIESDAKRRYYKKEAFNLKKHKNYEQGKKD